jgi:hypothetical protein
MTKEEVAAELIAKVSRQVADHRLVAAERHALIGEAEDKR